MARTASRIAARSGVLTSASAMKSPPCTRAPPPEEASNSRVAENDDPEFLSGVLIRAHAEVLDHLLILAAFGAYERCELIDRHWAYVCAGVRKLVLDLRLHQKRVDRAVEPRNHIAWRLRRREEADPQRKVEILERARLGDGRNIRGDRRTRRRGHRQHFQQAGFHVRNDRRHAREIEIDMAADEIVERRRGALVR